MAARTERASTELGTRAPLELVRGAGGRCFDADGKEYVDWICGYGPVILGHGHPSVVRAVERQLAEGSLFSGCWGELERLRERLAALFPHAESAFPFKTGSEAVAAAIRLARAATGRSLVLRVGFHGWHDELVDPSFGWHNYDHVRVDAPEVLGVPEAGRDERVRVCSDLELDGLPDLVDDERNRVAAVVLDPIQCHGDIGRQLGRLAEACRRAGALFVLDETKTAFRVHPGGVQGLYGVAADVTVAGKGLANGLPLAVVLTTASVGGFRRPARIKGTFAEERLAIAAAHATLDVMERESVARRLKETGQRLIDAMDEALREERLDDLVSAVAYRWPSMPHLHAATDSPEAVEARRLLVEELEVEGVLVLDGHNSFVCLAHDDADLEWTRDALAAAAARVARALEQAA